MTAPPAAKGTAHSAPSRTIPGVPTAVAGGTAVSRPAQTSIR